MTQRQSENISWQPQAYSWKRVPVWLIIVQVPFFILIMAENYLMATGLLVSMALVIFILENPVNGLLFLPFFLYMPFEIPSLGGVQFSEMGALLVILSFVCSILLTRSDLAFDFPAFRPLMLILIAMGLSIANAKYLIASLKDLLKFIEAFFIIFLFTVNFIRNRDAIRRIFLSFICSGVLASLIGIYRFVNGYDSRVFGLLGGGFGAFIGTSVLMAINILVFSNKKGEKLTALLSLPIMIFALVLSQTRAWFAGLLLALLFLLYHLRGSKSIKFATLALSLVLITVALLSLDVFTPSQAQIITSGTAQAFETGFGKGETLGKYVSVLMRVFIWIHGFSIYMQNPILGYGIGNLRIKNYFTGDLGDPSDPQVGYIDNHWLNVLYETGILGIIGWIWFALLVFKSCKKLIGVSIEPEWKMICFSLIGSMLIYLVGGMFWVLTVAHEMTAVIPFLIGLIFASLRIIENENKARTELKTNV